MDEAAKPANVTAKVYSRPAADNREHEPPTVSLTDRVIAFVDSRLRKVRTSEDWKNRKAG